MQVLAIDPGPEKSAYVIWDGQKIIKKDITWNDSLLIEINNFSNDLLKRKELALVIEQIKSYGMAVSDSIFGTVFWSGRFVQQFQVMARKEANLIPRIAVKMHLCHNSRAKDGNIKQAIIDRFGGKEKAVGKKANPGLLYGLKHDLWQAFALVLTFCDNQARWEAGRFE